MKIVLINGVNHKGSTYHIATEETEEYVNQLVQEINGAADSLRRNPAAARFRNRPRDAAV